jgi:hypothetical protein
VKRSKLLMNNIHENKFRYSELGMYTIHLEANRTHRKLVFKRPELLGVRTRLGKRHPLLPGKQIPKPQPEYVPEEISKFIMEHDAGAAVKVEWFFVGVYYVKCNEQYNMVCDMERHADQTLYSKTIDTMNFSRYDIAFKTWLESVDAPGKVVQYQGALMHNVSKAVVVKTARMMSIVLDFEHIITATVLVD